MAQSPFKPQFGKTVKSFARNVFNRTKDRLLGANIRGDSRLATTTARWSNRNGNQDWRVRLTLPTEAYQLEREIFEGNDLMEPLADSRGMFWPLTPSMVVQHSANYNALAQTHSNYPFQAYQNSQVDQINIIGEFPVQNQQDAKHWVATINFLRTVTKMFFGNSPSLRGNPPPILHLSGYGDHVFSNVPVVVNTFNVELRSGIDYISTYQTQVGYNAGEVDPTLAASVESGESQTWAPTLSNISVLVTPVYSRNSVANRFNLQDFARGKLNGKDTGIGFV